MRGLVLIFYIVVYHRFREMGVRLSAKWVSSCEERGRE